MRFIQLVGNNDLPVYQEVSKIVNVAPYKDGGSALNVGTQYAMLVKDTPAEIFEKLAHAHPNVTIDGTLAKELDL